MDDRHPHHVDNAFVQQRRSTVIFAVAMLALVANIVYPSFIPKDVMVTISNINENGGAKVTEDIHFLLTTEQDKQKYELTLGKNDIASWSSATGLESIKYYVDPDELEISNVRVTPYPLQTYSSSYGGRLTIEYFVSPIINRSTNKPVSNGSSLFITTQYKPRTYRYGLNPKVLNFKRTSRGDIILSDQETLRIILPEKSIVYEASPSPKGTNYKCPVVLKSAEWSNQVLVKFSFVFDVEKNMSYEITSGIRYVILKMIHLFESGSGILLLIMVASIGFGAWMVSNSAKYIHKK